MSHPYKGHSQNAVGKRRANKLVHGNEYGRAEGGPVESQKKVFGSELGEKYDPMERPIHYEAGDYGTPTQSFREDIQGFDSDPAAQKGYTGFGHKILNTDRPKHRKG